MLSDADTASDEAMTSDADTTSDADEPRAGARSGSRHEQLRSRVGTVVARVAVSALALLTATGIASAQHGGGGMMGGGGYGTFGIPGFGLVVWLLVGLGIVVLVAYARDGGRSDTDTTDRALETLRERYARGDITSEEFQARRAELERSR